MRDKALNISSIVSMSWTLCEGCGSEAKVLHQGDTREQVALINIDYAFDYYIPKEEEESLGKPFIPYEFAQEQVGTSIPTSSKQEAMIPECLLYVPLVVPRAESPIISDVEEGPVGVVDWMQDIEDMRTVLDATTRLRMAEEAIVRQADTDVGEEEEGAGQTEVADDGRRHRRLERIRQLFDRDLERFERQWRDT